MHRGGSRGVDRPDAVLDEADVIEIRRLRALPPVQRPKLSELARRYAVSPPTVCRAAKGRKWKHVGGTPARHAVETDE